MSLLILVMPILCRWKSTFYIVLACKVVEPFRTANAKYGNKRHSAQPGPEIIKLFSCSPQLSIKYFLLINVKMSTIVGILTFMSGKNSILGLSEPKKCRISRYLYTYELLKFHAQ